MRSGPIGIYCAGDPEKAKYLARVDAEVSHSEEGIWGAQAVAVAVSLAMVDADMDQIWAGVMDCAPKGSWFEETLNRGRPPSWNTPAAAWRKLGCPCTTICSPPTVLPSAKHFLKSSVA